MILATILALTLVILAVIVVLAVSAGGSIFIVVFADVIVCMIFIAWIIRLIVKKKRR